MIGSYLIIVHNQSDDLVVKVGKLGNLAFKSGIFAYVGSAQGRNSTSLKHRVLRHLRSNLHNPSSSFPKPKIHWHIDYFLSSPSVKVIKIFLIPSKIRIECDIAKQMEEISDGSVKKFGSSDCGCKSHLFYFSKTIPKWAV